MSDRRLSAARSLVLVVAFAVALIACHPTPPPPPAGEDCHAACSRAATLSSADPAHPLAPDTPEGKKCDVWLCESPVSSARLSCMAHAADPAVFAACR